MGIGQRQQCQQFGGNALATEALEGMREFAASLLRRRIERRPEARLKAEIAQDPQVILGNPRAGITDEAHPPRREIFEPAEIVRNRQRFGMGIECVDSEIAPCGILRPVAGEGDGGSPAIGGDIAAQRGDLDRPVLEDRGDGAVLDPGRHSADAGLAAGRDHLGGHQLGGAIDIMHRRAQQAVAHRPADPADILRPQCCGERGKARAAWPFGFSQITQHLSAFPPRSAAQDWR